MRAWLLITTLLCLLNPPLSGDCPTNDLLWRSSSSLDSPHESSIFMHMHAIQQDAHVDTAGHPAGKASHRSPQTHSRSAQSAAPVVWLPAPALPRNQESRKISVSRLSAVSVIVQCCCRAPKRDKSTAELAEAQWEREEHGCCGAACPPTVLIPALILFSDLIGSLASGVTPSCSQPMSLAGNHLSTQHVLLHFSDIAAG